MILKYWITESRAKFGSEKLPNLSNSPSWSRYGETALFTTMNPLNKITTEQKWRRYCNNYGQAKTDSKEGLVTAYIFQLVEIDINTIFSLDGTCLKIIYEFTDCVQRVWLSKSTAKSTVKSKLKDLSMLASGWWRDLVNHVWKRGMNVFTSI